MAPHVHPWHPRFIMFLCNISTMVSHGTVKLQNSKTQSKKTHMFCTQRRLRRLPNFPRHVGMQSFDHMSLCYHQIVSMQVPALEEVPWRNKLAMLVPQRKAKKPPQLDERPRVPWNFWVEPCSFFSRLGQRWKGYTDTGRQKYIKARRNM